MSQRTIVATTTAKSIASNHSLRIDFLTGATAAVAFVATFVAVFREIFLSFSDIFLRYEI